MSELLNESFNIKLDKEVKFGTNAPDYDDGVIKLFQFERTFYTCTKTEDEKILVVGVSMVTGKVTMSVAKNDQVEGAMRSGILDRREAYMGAFKLLPIAFNLLYVILDAYKVRIKNLVFVARDEYSARVFTRLFKNGVFRTVMSKFRFKPDLFAEPHENSDGEKVLVFSLSKKIND